MNFKIAVVKGDGIGPEVVEETLKVLDNIGKKFGHKFQYEFYKAGGCAIDEFKVPLPKETLKGCKNSDAVLLGAVGGPKWDHVDINLRPEKALLGLRGEMNLYCNLRPAVLYNPLRDASPLKNSIIEKGIDLCVVRELTGGIYFGDKNLECVEGIEVACDTERYSTIEIERIAKMAFEIARKRNRKVTSVDKANVLETSRLWRKTVNKVALNYIDVELEHLYIDNTSMQIVRDPSQFDVILTSNMFGDILSDEASMITGSIGMLPSASLGKNNFGMYEPIHGSAPDIAGKSIANPLATILSAAMMLRYSFSLEKEARSIEEAVQKVLEDGYRTKDIMSTNYTLVSTIQMGDLVVERL